MPKNIRYINAAWGIVANPETKKILMTIKNTDPEERSKILKEITINSQESLLKILKKIWCEFTKWKVEEGQSKKETAFRELEEEWGVERENITKVKDLGEYTEHCKKHRIKTINMSLYELLTQQDKYIPTDKKHIPIWLSVEDAIKYNKHPAEKKFLKDNRKKLYEALGMDCPPSLEEKYLGILNFLKKIMY